MKGWVFIIGGLAQFKSTEEMKDPEAEGAEDAATFYQGRVKMGEDWVQHGGWYRPDQIFKTKKAAIASL